MLPKYHILYGAIFSLLIFIIYPKIGIGAALIFLSSVLIDVDHYFVYVFRKRDLSLRRANSYFLTSRPLIKKYLKQGKNPKAPLMIFHTMEFLFLILILAFYNSFFLLLLSGFLFHSLLDMVDIYLDFNTLSPRYFLITSYFLNRKNPKIKYL